MGNNTIISNSTRISYFAYTIVNLLVLTLHSKRSIPNRPILISKWKPTIGKANTSKPNRLSTFKKISNISNLPLDFLKNKNFTGFHFKYKKAILKAFMRACANTTKAGNGAETVITTALHECKALPKPLRGHAEGTERNRRVAACTHSQLTLKTLCIFCPFHKCNKIS